VAEDFAFDEDRLCWRSVRFYSMEQSLLDLARWGD
jgi:hypothetical protein